MKTIRFFSATLSLILTTFAVSAQAGVPLQCTENTLGTRYVTVKSWTHASAGDAITVTDFEINSVVDQAVYQVSSASYDAEGNYEVVANEMNMGGAYRLAKIVLSAESALTEGTLEISRIGADGSSSRVKSAVLACDAQMGF